VVLAVSLEVAGLAASQLVVGAPATRRRRVRAARRVRLDDVDEVLVQQLVARQQAELVEADLGEAGVERVGEVVTSHQHVVAAVVLLAVATIVAHHLRPQFGLARQGAAAAGRTGRSLTSAAASSRPAVRCPVRGWPA